MMLIDVLNYYSKEVATVNEVVRAPVLGVAIALLERNDKRGKYTNSLNFAKQIIQQIVQGRAS